MEQERYLEGLECLWGWRGMFSYLRVQPGLQRREGTKLDNTPVRGVRVWTRGSSWGTE